MVGKDKKEVNKGLKDWVIFVKKVQAEEGITYPEAIHVAKARKDKGEDWMSGGGVADSATPVAQDSAKPTTDVQPKADTNPVVSTPGGVSSSTPTVVGVRGGSKKQKTAKKQQKTAKKQKGGRRKTCFKK
jgi:hypothetical protein